jgi:hypothetical protein
LGCFPDPEGAISFVHATDTIIIVIVFMLLQLAERRLFSFDDLFGDVPVDILDSSLYLYTLVR